MSSSAGDGGGAPRSLCARLKYCQSMNGFMLCEIRQAGLLERPCVLSRCSKYTTCTCFYILSLSGPLCDSSLMTWCATRLSDKVSDRSAELPEMPLSSRHTAGRLLHIMQSQWGS